MGVKFCIHLIQGMFIYVAGLSSRFFRYKSISLVFNLSSCPCVEPYNYFGRRGRKEPEALAAASLKRLFVENQPYLVSGYSQHEFSGKSLPSNGDVSSKLFSNLQGLKTAQLDAPNNILSMAEKYEYMRNTFRKRLAFGKD